MDWNDIRVLVEVARTGSFTAAAVTLGSSKPTVSRHVAALERMAGTRIFRRTPQGAVLTEAGEILLQRALKIEIEVLDLEKALQFMKQDAASLVSVRMSEGVAAYLIAPALAGQELGPLGIAAQRLHLKLPPMRILPPDSPRREDLALVWVPLGRLPTASPAAKVRKLADIRFVPFRSIAYSRAGPHLDSFEHLREHQLVTMGAYSWFSDGGWQDWHSLLGGAKKRPVSVDWSCSLGHLTLSGAGVGLLPTYSIMYADGILPLDMPIPPMMASIWMVHSEDAAKDKAVRACIDALVKLFKEADWLRGL